MKLRNHRIRALLEALLRHREEDDLQYNRARHFDPACGRWISDEPLGFASGDEKLTRYVDAPVE